MGSPEGVGPCCLRSALFCAFSICLSWRARSFWRLVKEGRELAISAPFKDRISVMNNHTCFTHLTLPALFRFKVTMGEHRLHTYQKSPARLRSGMPLSYLFPGPFERLALAFGANHKLLVPGVEPRHQ